MFIDYLESIINRISCRVWWNIFTLFTISPSLHLVSFIIAFAEWIKISQGASEWRLTVQCWRVITVIFLKLNIFNFRKTSFQKNFILNFKHVFCRVLWTLISSWLSQRLLNNYPANYFNLNKIGNLKWHQLNQREFEISSSSSTNSLTRMKLPDSTGMLCRSSRPWCWS